MQPRTQRNYLGATIRRTEGGFFRKSQGLFLLAKTFRRKPRRARIQNPWAIFSTRGQGGPGYFPSASPAERAAMARRLAGA